jgi:hypothetical protein
MLISLKSSRLRLRMMYEKPFVYKVYTAFSAVLTRRRFRGEFGGKLGKLWANMDLMPQHYIEQAFDIHP